MKTILLLAASLLTLATGTTVFAADRAPSLASEVVTTLDELLARNRVAVGAARESVINEMRAPNLVLHPNVWVYTGFQATNVRDADKFDSLVITFKDDKVQTLVLAKEAQIRIAATRLVPANVARR